jgi:hypothetical protein
MKFIPVLIAFLVCMAPVAAQSGTPRISQHPMGSHAVAIAANGQLFAWGSNNLGQLGNGTLTSSTTPISIPVNYPAPAKDCAAGQDFSLLLAANNTVWAWGSDADGRLGTSPTGNPKTSPTQVPGLSDVVAIAAGSQFALALLGDGTVRAWGSNVLGQNGSGSTVSGGISTPQVVRINYGSFIGILANVVAIAAGDGHALALCSNGEVYAWGKDYSGQCGDGQASTSLSASNYARKMPNVSAVVAIAAGADHSLVVRSNGSVLACGLGQAGRLGTGSTADENATPAAVQGVSNVIAAAGGVEQSLFLTVSGAVYGCGRNSNYRLGLSDPSTVYPSTLLSDAGTCMSVTAGRLSSWFIGANGLAKVCGSGGALGLANSPATVITAMTNLPLGPLGGFQFLLSSVGDGIQMMIPPNNFANALAYPTTALYYANVYSMNLVNGGPLFGQGNWFGLHVTPAELDAHISMAAAGFDMVSGPLDPSGGAYAVYPLLGAGLSGTTVWGVSIVFSVNATSSQLQISSPVTSTTL